jgi:hypothetical protein
MHNFQLLPSQYTPKLVKTFRVSCMDIQSSKYQYCDMLYALDTYYNMQVVVINHILLFITKMQIIKVLQKLNKISQLKKKKKKKLPEIHQ